MSVGAPRTIKPALPDTAARHSGISALSILSILTQSYPTLLCHPSRCPKTFTSRWTAYAIRRTSESRTCFGALVEERGVKRTEPTSVEQGWWYTGDAGEGLAASDMILPDQANLRGKYRGTYVNATIGRGKLVMAGKEYGSLSAAARAVAERHGVIGAGANVNGWRFWEMEYPAASGRWRRLDSFRKPWQVKRRRS